MKIYPNFEILTANVQRGEQLEGHVNFRTLIRVKGEDNIWYLFPFNERTVIDNVDNKDNLFAAISRANTNAYIAQQFTIINEETKKYFPDLTKDTNQVDERKRLIPIE